MNLRSILLFLFSVSLVLVLLFNIQCTTKPDTLTYLNHHDTVKYVGMQACRTCHESIYQTFIQTGMGQSFDVATPQKSVAQFSSHHAVYDRFNDMYYFPFRSRDTMYIMEFRLEGKDTIHKRTECVDYIVGSGQHTNSHLMEVNGYVYQLPLTWYAQEKKWDLPPGFESGRNVRFNRIIGTECMSCHNAMPKIETGSENKFVNIPRGIDCERCHGPGELHVKEKLEGKWVDTATQIDYTIVNPRKLPWELQIDVCQRCHLQGNAVTVNHKQFTDFRPGMKLSDFMHVYMPRYENREDEFIMASHAQRLQMSNCFIKSGKDKAQNKLTCITCHNPHVSVKVTGRQVFNAACMNCHTDQSCKETITTRNAANNNCVNCHMPRSGTIDIPHVSVHDHKIAVHKKAESKSNQKVFTGIYPVNTAIQDEEVKLRAWLKYYESFEGERSALDSATKLLAKASPDDRIHLFYLKKDNQSIIGEASKISASDVKEPWTLYRIGQAYFNEQQYSKALQWLKLAMQAMPLQNDFKTRYAAACIMNNQIQPAIQLLYEVLQVQPKHTDALTNLGFAYVLQKNYVKAQECYEKALQYDPDFYQALLNMAGMYNLRGDRQKALYYLKRMQKTYPGNREVEQLIQQLSS
jgi:Flp pilus assembly protein TadD